MSNSPPQIRLPAKVQAAETPGLSGLLTLAVAVVVVASLYLAREVLIPITLAILLSFLLSPVVALLRRIRLPRVVAVLLAVVIGFGAILSVGAVIGVQVAGLATEVPNYAATIEKKVDWVREATLGRLTTLTARFERHPAPAAAPSTKESQPGPTASRQNTPLGDGTRAVPVQVQQPPAEPLDLARTILAPIIGPVSDLLIVIIIAVFVLMQREDLRDRMIRLFGSNDLHRTTVALDDAARRLGRYFLAQLGINTSFGLIIAIGLWIIGVPSPFLWGVLSGLFRFVPYIGPVIGGLLPAAVAAAVEPGWSMVIWTAALYVAVEAITGQAIEPLIYGHSTGLSPVAVVVSAIFWTWIWGPIGLVLSTPLTLCLVVLGRHVERLEFLDVLLGDQPALTPVENFYQRMLAEDADETLRQAELFLKEKSLTSYYDEVALKGLQLAANDVARGVLTADGLQFIRTSAHDLIEELAVYDDVDPLEKKADLAGETKAEPNGVVSTQPPDGSTKTEDQSSAWRAGDLVLCLAGRGPLDEVASAMVAQLLSKHGLRTRAEPYVAASRDAIGSLDLSDIAMICISYLEISGNPSNLHYLLRRLRSKAPEIPVLVGLWPSEDEVIRDKRMRGVIGADYYTTTLKEAIEACVAQSRSGSAPPSGQSESDMQNLIPGEAVPFNSAAAVT